MKSYCRKNRESTLMLDPVFCFFKQSPTRTHLSGSLLCPIVCVNISVLFASTLVGPFVFSRAHCHSSATLTALQGHQRWKGPYGGRGERAGLRKMTSVCHLYINICVCMWQATELRVSARAGSPNSIHTSISQSVPDLNKTQYQMIWDANY